MEENTMMTTEEVMRLLNVSRSTVNRLRKNGEINANKFEKAVRFDRKEVEVFLQRTKQRKQ